MRTPIPTNAIPVIRHDNRNAHTSKTYGMSGINQTMTNATSVQRAIESGVLFPTFSLFAARYALIDIDAPSAKRFARPKIMMVALVRSPHVAPATTAKVVTVPSTAPYTI